MSHVDVKNLKPTSFEDEYYDQYEYYNLTDKYAGETTSRSADVHQLKPGHDQLFVVFAETELDVFPQQKAQPGKAGPRRRPARTPTDTTPPGTSASSWRNCRTARRKPRSDF